MTQSSAEVTSIALDDASAVAQQALGNLGLKPEEVSRTVPHLLDCELRGLEYSGLARILSIRDRLRTTPSRGREPVLIRHTPVSALFDGGDRIGYSVAQIAVDEALNIASGGLGVAVVGANNTWYTGMLSYYAEQIAHAGMAGMLASSASAWVAPFGSNEPLMGTNPICFVFPGEVDPFIWDIGISEVTHAQVVIAERTGTVLPSGQAYDNLGNPTRDPSEALSGAFVNWGGHRGSGLGLSIQLLGALVGAPLLPGELRDFGFFALAISPHLFGDPEDFYTKVTSYLDRLDCARPAVATQPVRAPFTRSVALRTQRLQAGCIDVSTEILGELRELAATVDQTHEGGDHG